MERYFQPARTADLCRSGYKKIRANKPRYKFFQSITILQGAKMCDKIVHGLPFLCVPIFATLLRSLVLKDRLRLFYQYLTSLRVEGGDLCAKFCQNTKPIRSIESDRRFRPSSCTIFILLTTLVFFPMSHCSLNTPQ